jgi:hypothetical protein
MKPIEITKEDLIKILKHRFKCDDLSAQITAGQLIEEVIRPIAREAFKLGSNVDILNHYEESVFKDWFKIERGGNLK